MQRAIVSLSFGDNMIEHTVAQYKHYDMSYIEMLIIDTKYAISSTSINHFIC